MKELKTLILAFIGFMLIYLFTSFVQWQFNAGQWSDDARFFTALIGFATALIISCGYLTLGDDKSN